MNRHMSKSMLITSEEMENNEQIDTQFRMSGFGMQETIEIDMQRHNSLS